MHSYIHRHSASKSTESFFNCHIQLIVCYIHYCLVINRSLRWSKLQGWHLISITTHFHHSAFTLDISSTKRLNCVLSPLPISNSSRAQCKALKEMLSPKHTCTVSHFKLFCHFVNINFVDTEHSKEQWGPFNL